ncbi:MAG: nitrite reductase small subunit NirD [Motiliproteus sp.]|nr:nitrite reductase small subunit NirD [Motiliproteus sp.]MCW9054036.1 nitrite reductase small subunit NirD [Motiliproteus sp.]
MTQATNWTPVCALTDIAPNTGVCALVNGQQVALFRLADSEAVYAIGNYDPAGKANVLSRGLIADLDGVLSVASPLYKQHYCLKSGNCQEDETLSVPTYEVRLNEGQIEVAA